MSHIVTMTPSKEKKHVEFKHEFELIEDRNCGFSFPTEPDENYDCWSKNLEYAKAHPEEYEDMGIVKHEWYYREPAVGHCSCGKFVALTGDTQCECGQWYNAFGQALKDPRFWEEY